MSSRRCAVSYSRFSDPKQAAGDSAERQDRLYKEFCERHDLTPGKEVFADRGRSGYHGEHRTKGKLGLLLDAAKSGQFEPGTVIVIEAWDRLGRLRPDRQTELVAELLRTGVSIGVCRLNDIFSEDDFGTHKWTTLAVFIQLAHQESKQKAERVSASWAARRKKAREEGSPLRSSLPAWITVAGGEMRLIPERAAAIQRIYHLAAEGLGIVRIIRQLQKEKVKPFGEKVVRVNRTRSQFAGQWSRPYVGLLLRDRRVLGELQPYKGDNPDGPPLVNYFPAVVTDEQFALVRAAQESRISYEPVGPTRKAPRQRKYVNVFKGMLKHARDDEGFHLHNKGTVKAPFLLLLTASGIDGHADRAFTFPYLVFEEKVLGLLKEIDPDSVMPTTSAAPSSADAIRAKLAKCRTNLAGLKEDLRKDGYSKVLASMLRETEEEEVALANELQDELARTTKPLARSWAELPSLIDVIREADDPDAARLKVRSVLRAVVESAHVLIVPSKSWRFAVVQFVFVGGARRTWCIAHQTAANGRQGGSAALSLAEMGWPTNTDLRTKPAWEKLEKLILKHAGTIHEAARKEHARRKCEAARAKYAKDAARRNG